MSIKEERKKDRTDKGLKFKPRMTTSTKIGCECVFTLKKNGDFLVISDYNSIHNHPLNPEDYRIANTKTKIKY